MIGSKCGFAHVTGLRNDTVQCVECTSGPSHANTHTGLFSAKWLAAWPGYNLCFRIGTAYLVQVYYALIFFQRHELVGRELGHV